MKRLHLISICMIWKKNQIELFRHMSKYDMIIFFDNFFWKLESFRSNKKFHTLIFISESVQNSKDFWITFNINLLNVF